MRTGCTSPRAAMLASTTVDAGTTTSFPSIAATIGTMPRTGRTEPSRPSSPMNAKPSMRDASMIPATISTPTAIARSSPEPVFRPSHGARLMVIRWFGQSCPELARAARARSRASRIDSSGRPTMCRPGSPLPRCTSTWTAWPRAPRSIADGTEANIAPPLDDTARLVAPQRTSRRGERASRPPSRRGRLAPVTPPDPSDTTEGVSQSTRARCGAPPCHTLGRARSPRIRSPCGRSPRDRWPRVRSTPTPATGGPA